MKAQAAFEFLTIVAISITIITITSMFGLNYLTSYSGDINTLNAKRMAETITSAANMVYSQGIGAQIKIRITVPEDVLTYYTYTYKNEINIRFSKEYPTDANSKSATNLYGTIPIGTGPISMYVKMKKDGAHLFLDVNGVSYIGLKLYNDSAYSKEDNSFSLGETVYYSVELQYLNEIHTDKNITLRIYDPNGNIFYKGTFSTTNGFYNSSFVPDETGFWMISAEVEEIKSVGATIAKVV